jgi:hypothetical protein
MPIAIAEMIAMVTMVFLIGFFILMFPISRRLGKALEEWVKLRHETSPDRDALARIEGGLLEIRQHIESLDQRVDLIGDRQDFTERLIETKGEERQG